MRGYACRGLTLSIRRRRCDSGRLHFFLRRERRKKCPERQTKQLHSTQRTGTVISPLTARQRIHGRTVGASLLLIGALGYLGCAPAASTIRVPSRQVTEAFSSIPAAPWIIAIDAGHGGHDPGASYHGLREKHLNLDIARRLSEELQARGVTTVMTRSQDVFVPLSRRPAIAAAQKADLFVSIHVNANRNHSVSGIEVYYPRVSTVSTDNLPPYVKSSEVDGLHPWIRQILWDTTLSRFRRHSARMGSAVCRAMAEQLGAKCNGVKGARFVVLREATMPAVLVECGYVSNRAEASRLNSTTYRQAIAEAIAGGVMGYAKTLEPRAR